MVSNQRPPRCRRGALPLSYQDLVAGAGFDERFTCSTNCLVPPARVELAASSLSATRPYRLGHGGMAEGAGIEPARVSPRRRLSGPQPYRSANPPLAPMKSIEPAGRLELPPRAYETRAPPVVLRWLGAGGVTPLASCAGGGGFEPPRTGSEPVRLPDYLSPQGAGGEPGPCVGDPRVERGVSCIQGKRVHRLPRPRSVG